MGISGRFSAREDTGQHHTRIHKISLTVTSTNTDLLDYTDNAAACLKDSGLN
jgi:hypothetical protein